MVTPIRIGRQRSGRTLVLGVVIVLAMVGVFLAIVLRPRPPAGVSVATVEAWLNDNGFDVFRPFRDNVPPGTLLRLERRGQSVAVTLSETGLPESDPAHAAGVSWQVETKLDALAEAPIVPGLQVARLKDLGVVRVVVSIDDVTIREIPLVKLADAVKRNPALVRAAKARDPSMVLVGSVIEAGKVQAEFFTSDNAKLDLQVPERSGKIGVGASFEVSSEGKLASTRPLLLGYRAYDLMSEALSFGPDPPVVVKVKALTPQELEAKRGALPEPQALRTEFQLFALVLGLGNYSAALPGVPEGARHMESLLQPLIDADHPERLAVRTSPPGSNRPVTRIDVLTWIDEFVAKNVSHVDHEKQAMTVVYFGGHGLAEGIARSAFVVPEDVRLGKDVKTLNVAEDLVHIGEILDRLTPLSEHSLLLMDMCREHAAEDDELVRAWEALGQNAANMKDILAVLNFTAGTIGPSAVLFGGPDGRDQPTVITPWSTHAGGGLAVRFDAVLADLQRFGGDLTPAEFIREMQKPMDGVRAGDLATVPLRAYTALRSDFLDALPRAKLFGTSATSLAKRDSPYRPPGSAESGSVEIVQEEVASGVRVSRVSGVSIPDIVDFVYAAAARRFYALDWEGNLFSWKDGDTKPHLLKAELGAPSIASTANAELYVHDGATNGLYRGTQGRVLGKVDEDVFLGLLATGAGGESVLVVESDSTIGTADEIARWQNGKRSAAATFDTAPISALVETSPGEFVYSDYDGRIVRRRGDQEVVIAEELDRPGALAARDGELFCLGAGGVLYKVAPDGRVWRVDLADVGFPDEYARADPNRGLLVGENRDSVWVAAGDGIHALDLRSANWRNVAGE